jgi:hypothetical protein
MDEPQFSLAFIIVKESFVAPAICFYLESATNSKDGGGATLSSTTPEVGCGVGFER